MTGDGKNNRGRPSIFETVTNTLILGWHVEVWTWRASCSERYISLANYRAGAGSMFDLHFLDQDKDRRDFLNYSSSSTSNPPGSPPSVGGGASVPNAELGAVSDWE